MRAKTAIHLIPTKMLVCSCQNLIQFLFLPASSPSTGNTQLHLVSSEPLDYERHPSFTIDLSVGNGPVSPVLSLESPPAKTVIRIRVTVENVEDEKPVFFPETLFNAVERNSALW